MAYPRSPQWRDGMFKNPAEWPERPRFGSFVRWQLSGRPSAPRDFRPPSEPNDGARLRADRQTPSVTWIGHASLLCQAGGVAALTDPVFSDRLGFLRRYAPPGLDISALPHIDLVIISHNHRDHLDEPSVQRLGRDTQFVVPLGLREWFVRRGFRRVLELDWWQTESLATDSGPARVTLVPAQHWSQRGLFDENQSLWGGFLMELGGELGESRGASFYFAGDTGYPAAFGEIGRRFPGADFALLPIGAYEPRWFMAPQHMGPEQAARAFGELQARMLVPMHWGTFRLTDEPMEEPPRLLERALGADLTKLVALPIGGTKWGK